jgi:hypothetical protein
MTKTRWMLTAVVAAIVTAVVTAWVCLLPVDVSHARIDRLIAEFRSYPNPESAARLAEAINYGYASNEQGDQIVPLLLKPWPVLDREYPCDKQIHFKMQQPFQVYIPAELGWFRSSERFVPAQTHWAAVGDYSPLREIERSFEWGAPPYPVGVQHVVAKYQCSWPYWLTRPQTTWRDRLIRWLGLGPADKSVTYEASWEVPFDINIVAPEQATGPTSRPAPQPASASRPASRPRPPKAGP